MQGLAFIMRSPALFAIFLVGTAAAVYAQDKPSEPTERISHNEKQPEPRRDAQRQGDWVELGDPSPAKYGTVYVMVGEDSGLFGKLRLDATTGKVHVKQVRVTFVDGKSKVYKVNKTLAGKKKATIVDLGDPRAIDQVAITTDRRGGGEYALHGAQSGGIVAER
jgi:hypothetical protein